MEESFKLLILVYWFVFWGRRGGKDCFILIVFKNFIFRMVGYYGGLDIFTEIEFWVFNFIFLGL